MSTVAPPEKEFRAPAATNVKSITDTMTSLRSSYEAARETQFTQRPSRMPVQGVGYDYHLHNNHDFYYLLEFSRYLEHNDPVLSQGVTRFVANVIQDGFMLKPETGSDILDRKQLDWWQRFSHPGNAQNVDYQLQSNWSDIERLAVHRMVFDGDMGVVPMSNGRLQMFESHRIDNPYYTTGTGMRTVKNVFLGVEKNSKGQITRYWVNPDYDARPQQMSVNGRGGRSWGVRAWEFDDITQRNEPNFFHVIQPHRFNQSRGVTAFAPVLQIAGMHGDLQFATLVKQQLSSFIGFVHELPQVTGENDPEYVPPEAETYWCHKTNRLVSMGPELNPGAEYWPRYRGEKIQPFQANIPSTEFFPHSKLLLTFLSLQLGMPLILFLLDATETNFSAWRGALDQAKIQFKQFQQNIANRLHTPVWRWKLRRFMRQDRTLRAAYDMNGEEALNFSWQTPNWPYIEPLKDVQADAAEVGANLNSPRRISARRGLDYKSIVSETVEDRGFLIEQALDEAARLNQHPYIIERPDEAVTWREISHPVLADGLQMQILDKASGGDDEKDDDSGGQEQKKAAA